MTATAIIMYHGTIDHIGRFRDHYENVHLRLLWNLPGIRRVELHWDEVGEVALVTHLLFDSMIQLTTSLNGQERDKLRADMEQNITPRFHGTVLYAQSERVVFDPPSPS